MANIKRVVWVIVILIVVFFGNGCEYISFDPDTNCKSGQELIDDICVDIECADDEINDDGNCVKIVCRDGYYIEDGTCVEETDLITVYYQAPSYWDGVYIYFYDVSPSLEITWDSAPLMTEDSSNPGWYYYSFPNGTSKATVMFKDGSGRQIPEVNVPGEEVTVTTWFYEDFYSNTTTSPNNARTPIIQVQSIGNDVEGTEYVDIVIDSDSPLIDMYYYLNDVRIDMNYPNVIIDLMYKFNPGDEITLTVHALNSTGETISDMYHFKVFDEIDYPELSKIEAFNELRIYQIYISAYMDGTSVGYQKGYGPNNYGGDLQGITDSLDYIASLGVNSIWLTPIFESYSNSAYDPYQERGRTTGYFADNYYRIDPNFGTEEDLRTLISSAHDLGLYVFLDGVFGHHGYYDIEGVTNGEKQWYGYRVLYPDSLDYFIDVATYWIDEFSIDGWRIDQADQMYYSGYNYMNDIRTAVEELCLERQNAGEEWGILGYIVGEIYSDTYDVIERGYENNGIRSAFDFSTRYQLIRALSGNVYGETDDAVYINLAMKMLNYAPDYAQPNLMITNHDLVRLGDLIEINNLETYYWEIHKMALTFLTAYTGPITIYYGDEYGDNSEVLSGDISVLDNMNYIALDNIARTNGKTSNFTTLEQDLIDYFKLLMSIRTANSALYNGTRDNLVANSSLYIDIKTDMESQVLFTMNISKHNETFSFDSTLLDGSYLMSLITGEVVYPVDGYYTLELDQMSSDLFQVQ